MSQSADLEHGAAGLGREDAGAAGPARHGAAPPGRRAPRRELRFADSRLRLADRRLRLTHEGVCADIVAIDASRRHPLHGVDAVIARHNGTTGVPGADTPTVTHDDWRRLDRARALAMRLPAGRRATHQNRAHPAAAPPAEVAPLRPLQWRASSSSQEIQRGQTRARRKRSRMKIALWTIVGLIALFVLIQFIPYGRDHSQQPAANPF
jgi:hypothetical protein